MSLGITHAIALKGLEGYLIDVEAFITPGLPQISIVGLPDTAIFESRDRLRAAFLNSGIRIPAQKITLALSPASLRKEGSWYDLALAAALLQAMTTDLDKSQASSTKLASGIFLGELALNGTLRPVSGILPGVLAAKKNGARYCVVPQVNAAEAALVPGIKVYGAETLSQVITFLDDNEALTPARSVRKTHRAPGILDEDMQDIRGLSYARHAVEVAATGAHNLVLHGPPGSGKSMLAKRLRDILPDLTEEQSLEVTALSSLAGDLMSSRLPTENYWGEMITRPPWVAPHHNISAAALLGGGSGFARIGAVSRAHHGVLFLDEYAEIPQRILDNLRTPIEEGEVRIARRDGVARYPARFLLILAANPCPCAPLQERDCICSSTAKRRYTSKLSGPLVDRIDIKVKLRPPRRQSLFNLTETSPRTSYEIRQQVAQARERARHRWSDNNFLYNGQLPGKIVRKSLKIDSKIDDLLNDYLAKGKISERGIDRCLRVAWTLADLNQHNQPTFDDIASAIAFRQ